MSVGFTGPAGTTEPATLAPADPERPSVTIHSDGGAFVLSTDAPALLFAIDGAMWKVDNADPSVLGAMTPRQLIVMAALARHVADEADAARLSRDVARG